MLLEKVNTDTDDANGDRHKEHVDRCSEFHGEHFLEEADNKHHDDDLDDLILEVVKVLDLQEAVIGLGAPGDIDLGDGKFVHTETEDEEHHADEVQVNATDNTGQQSGVIDLKCREDYRFMETSQDLGRSRNEEEEGAEQTEYYGKDNDQAGAPEARFEGPFENRLLCQGLF